jgi:hypothetical protein
MFLNTRLLKRFEGLGESSAPYQDRGIMDFFLERVLIGLHSRHLFKPAIPCDSEL